MASLFDRIATRLARVQEAPRRDGDAVTLLEPAVQAPAADPMTLESLEAALDKLALARSEQMAIIYGVKLPRFDGHPTRFRERCCHAENPSTVFTGVPSPDR